MFSIIKKHEYFIFCCCVILLFVILIIPSVSYAKNASGHANDLNNSIGALSIESKSKLYPLWFGEYSISDLIDREASGSSFLNRIKKEFPTFNAGKYRHRIFFHWGFNTDPASYFPLNERLKECNIEDVEKFYYMVRKEQQSRNSIIINKISSITGIQSQPARGLATILYDVHILGDYSSDNEGAIGALLPFNNKGSQDGMLYDLIRHGFQRLIRPSDPKLYSEIRSSLESAGRGMNDKEKAEEILKVISHYLPVILDRQFKEVLLKKGIILTVSEPSVK